MPATTLTFLQASANRKLNKSFTKDSVQAYPLVKTFSQSHAHDVDISLEGLRTKLEIMQGYANTGWCLMKGPLSRTLENEPRAGLTDKQAMTQTLTLDIDGVTFDDLQLPTENLNNEHVVLAAERVIQELPTLFQRSSYIAHASSSFGLKGDKVSVHMDFFLKEEISPRALKEYLTKLNFKSEFFDGKLELTASGSALSYKIDRALADNSRIIYIAPPTFVGVNNPFADDNDRFVLVEKQLNTIDIAPELEDVSVEQNRTLVNKKIRQLRKMLGLSMRTEKTQSVMVNGASVSVVTNPDANHMQFYADNGDFVAYNIGKGDSNAYYVHKFSPEIVYNFKGEPNFLFEQADEDTYIWHKETFVPDSEHQIEEVYDAHLEPMVFRDYGSAIHYNGLFNKNTQLLESIHQCTSRDLEHFMAQYGGVMPDTIPIWNFNFDPRSDVRIDFKKRFLNKYQPPVITTDLAEIDDQFKGVSYGEADVLRELCPTIYKVLWNIVGSSAIEYEHFVNWLAHALQFKTKNMTAWILHGSQGTGKGVFFHNIIRPLYGNKYAVMKRLDDIEEQFNDWAETSLFLAVDEFRADDSRSTKKMINKMKNMITETRGPVRAMRSNARDVELYTNIVFFSNDQDAMRLTEDDRRFNIAPSQDKTLRDVIPDLHEALSERIPAELPAFASFIMQFNSNQTKATTALRNQAKVVMREASRTSIEEFVIALENGDLEYFIEILDHPLNGANDTYLVPARRHVKSFLRDYKLDLETVMWIADIRPLYNALVGKCETDMKFGKLLARNNLGTTKIKRKGVSRRGIRVTWKLPEGALEPLQERYLTEFDVAQLNSAEREIAFAMDSD